MAVHPVHRDHRLKSVSRSVGRAIRDEMERIGVHPAPAHKESHWLAVIESLGEGLIVLSATGQIQTANPEETRILGLVLLRCHSR